MTASRLPPDKPNRPPESSAATPAKPQSGNRRGFFRREGRGMVMCRMGKWGMGTPVLCRVKDVCEDGVAILYDTELPIGAEVEIELCGLAARKGRLVPAVVRRVLSTEEGFVLACNFEKRVSFPDISHLVKNA